MQHISETEYFLSDKEVQDRVNEASYIEPGEKVIVASNLGEKEFRKIRTFIDIVPEDAEEILPLAKKILNINTFEEIEELFDDLNIRHTTNLHDWYEQIEPLHKEGDMTLKEVLFELFAMEALEGIMYVIEKDSYDFETGFGIEVQNFGRLIGKEKRTISPAELTSFIVFEYAIRNLLEISNEMAELPEEAEGIDMFFNPSYLGRGIKKIFDEKIFDMEEKKKEFLKKFNEQAKYRIIHNKAEKEIFVITEDGGVSIIREADDSDGVRSLSEYYQTRITDIDIRRTIADPENNDVFCELDKGKIYIEEWETPYDDPDHITAALEWLCVGCDFKEDKKNEIFPDFEKAAGLEHTISSVLQEEKTIDNSLSHQNRPY